MKATIRLRLAAISEPEPMSRSVIRGRGDKVPPLFVGEGNVDYLCGGCGVVLANRVWRPSIGNVVAQCPACKAFNEFAALPPGNYAVVKLTKGHFNVSDAVVLRRGVRLEGE